MQVFCLMGGFEYEGQTLLGVYSSEEAARAARLELPEGDYDFYALEVRYLDAPAGAAYVAETRVIDFG